jgi:acyl-homoserine lactone acylase PvdQ
MPHLINPERGFIVTANNHIVDNKYKHWLNGGFMIDTRAKAIENAIESLINAHKKIDESIVMEKLLNIINDPFCSLMIKAIFNTLEKDENYNKIFKESSEGYYNKSKKIFSFFFLNFLRNK